jgi:hypothetical protein
MILLGVILLIIFMFILLVKWIKLIVKKNKDQKNNSNNIEGVNTHTVDIDLDNLFEIAQKSKQKNIDSYSPKDVENTSLSYFENLNELHSLYMPSRLKVLIDIIENENEFLTNVSEQSKFKEYLNEGIITFKLTNANVSINENEIETLKQLDAGHLNFFINQCILKQAELIVNKNYELINGYKRKDHIKGRYQTIVDSMDTLRKSVMMAKNYSEVNEFISLHKGRAYTRGQLHL